MIEWNGQTLELFDHPYNSTRLNERAVEIAVVLDWLPGKGTGLEIGNVLSHYGITGHRVVDLHEGPEHLDVMDVEGTYDWIIAISTIEHVHWDDDRDEDGSRRAIEHLRSLLNPGGQLLVTVPLGWHAPLDVQIKTGVLEPARDVVYYRQGDGWTAGTRRIWRPYGLSTIWAEAVWIGEWVA